MSKKDKNQTTARNEQSNVIDPRNGHNLIELAVRAQQELDAAKQGIEPTVKAMKEQRVGINTRMLNVVALFGGNVESFDNWCQEQETYIKSDSAGSLKVDRVPRCWIQGKSNILNAAKLGLDVSKYTSSTELNSDLQKARKAQKASPEAVATMAEKVDAILAQRCAALSNLFDKLSEADKDHVITALDTLIEYTADGEISSFLSVDSEDLLDVDVEDTSVDAAIAEEFAKQAHS